MCDTWCNSREDPEELSLTCFLHQPVSNHFEILVAPLWSPAIHLGHSVFAATIAALADSKRCQQPMKVRARTNALHVMFLDWIHGMLLSPEYGGSSGADSPEYGSPNRASSKSGSSDAVSMNSDSDIALTGGNGGGGAGG